MKPGERLKRRLSSQQNKSCRNTVIMVLVMLCICVGVAGAYYHNAPMNGYNQLKSSKQSPHDPRARMGPFQMSGPQGQMHRTGYQQRPHSQNWNSVQQGHRKLWHEPSNAPADQVGDEGKTDPLISDNADTNLDIKKTQTNYGNGEVYENRQGIQEKDRQLYRQNSKQPLYGQNRKFSSESRLPFRNPKNRAPNNIDYYTYYNYEQPTNQKIGGWNNPNYQYDYYNSDYEDYGNTYDNIPEPSLNKTEDEPVGQLLQEVHRLMSMIKPKPNQNRGPSKQWNYNAQNQRQQGGLKWKGRVRNRGPGNKYGNPGNKFLNYNYYQNYNDYYGYDYNDNSGSQDNPKSDYGYDYSDDSRSQDNQKSDYGYDYGYQSGEDNSEIFENTNYVDASTNETIADGPASTSVIMNILLSSSETTPTTEEVPSTSQEPSSTLLSSTTAAETASPETTSKTTSPTTTTATTTLSTATPTTTVTTNAHTTPSLTRPSSGSKLSGSGMYSDLPQDVIMQWLAKAESAWKDEQKNTSKGNSITTSKIPSLTQGKISLDTGNQNVIKNKPTDEYAEAAIEWAKQNQDKGTKKTDDSGFNFDPNIDYGKAAQEYAEQQKSPDQSSTSNTFDFDPNFDYAKAAKDYADKNKNKMDDKTQGANDNIISEEKTGDNDLLIMDVETPQTPEFELKEEIAIPQDNAHNNSPSEELELFVDEKSLTEDAMKDFLQGLTLSDEVMKTLEDKLNQEPGPLTTDVSQVLIQEMNTDSKQQTKIASSNDTFQISPPEFHPSYANPCWYDEATGNQLRCLPSFFVAGLWGCQTEEILEVLLTHPQVVLPLHLQPEWWSTKRHTGGTLDEDYVQNFDQAAKLIQQTLDPKTGQHSLLTLDASHNTLLPFELWKNHKKALSELNPNLLTPKQIQHILPKAKFVVALCEPSRRLYKAYEASDIKGSGLDFIYQTQKALSDIFTCQIKYKGDPKICNYGQPTSNDYNPFVEYLQTGLYAHILDPWLGTWNKKNFFFIKSDDLKTKKDIIVSRLLSFLSLSPLEPEELRKYKSTTGIKISYEAQVPRNAKKQLDKFYSKANTNLAQLLGDNGFSFNV